MKIPLDYITLRVIWWVLLGVLLIGFAVMDGFDLGVAMLLHRVTRTDAERRVALNAIGPVWEGNQVWLILGAGAIFAAWPDIYAVSFSGFYFAMLLVLFSLILRPVAIKYRGKLSNPRWRSMWDIGLAISGFVPAFIFGVAIGNVLQGIPFSFDTSLRFFYAGTFWGLLNPFALLCGLISISMLIMHGGIFLAIKTNNSIQQRAAYSAQISAIATIVLYIIAGIWTASRISGYVLAKPIALDGPSNPLHKHVVLQVGSWISNYQQYHIFKLAPTFAILGALAAILFISLRYFKLAWIASALSVAGIVTTVGVSMFPFILPSSSNPDMSLLVWDSSSSQMTLFTMLIATGIFLPLIMLYTSWVYYVLRGKVTDKHIQKNSQAY